MKFEVIFIILVLLSAVKAYVEMIVPDSKNVFDLNLYEEVLDTEQCIEQIRIVANNSMLLTKFFDAGPRTPRGVIKGNLVDMGNYYQCLEIDENIQNQDIKGKYCKIKVPLDQDIDWPSLPDWDDIPWPNITWPENITLPELPWPEINPYTTRLSSDTIEQIKKYNVLKVEIQRFIGAVSFENDGRSIESLSGLEFTLAICIPRPCSPTDALNNLLAGFDNLGLQYTEVNCRLPNDKQWVAADYTALVVFSLLLLFTTASTLYDIRQTVVLKRDPKSVNKLYQCFSVYTNTRRLLTFTTVPGAIECLDGVRALAMFWVIIGHTFVNQLSGTMANPIDTFNWITSSDSFWITSGPITVDTFFMISGLLVVYTTAGKMTRTKFITNVHLFYLNRLLRLFPVLAAAILLQASIFNRVTDGPNWELVANHVHRCRVYWWSTLLYFQNFYNPSSMCLAHSWYLAIDFHMFLISPLILYWVVSGRRRTAWVAIIAALLVSLTASTIYNFMMDFASATVTLSRPQDQTRYLEYYYVNTLTRCSPFFVGMVYGYMLHTYKGKKLVMTKIQNLSLWFIALGLIFAVVFTTYPIVQADWDNQLADNFINSFMRPVWALGVGWIVFACAKGYGGPINWILSLGMWKLLSRLSYAMYILHYPLIFVVNGTALAPVYFSVEFSLHKFATDFAIAVFSAFIVTLLVDSPCSTLIKMMMGGGPKRPPPAEKMEGLDNIKRDIDIVIGSPQDVSNKTSL